MTDRIHIIDPGRRYLRIEEAAVHACVSVSRFRRLVAELNIPAIPWAGVTVYSRRHIDEAMEEAEWRHCNGGAEPAATSSGRSAGEREAGSVGERLGQLQRSRKPRRAQRSRNSDSGSTGTVVELQSSDRPPSRRGA